MEAGRPSGGRPRRPRPLEAWRLRGRRGRGDCEARLRQRPARRWRRSQWLITTASDGREGDSWAAVEARCLRPQRRLGLASGSKVTTTAGSSRVRPVRHPVEAGGTTRGRNKRRAGESIWRRAGARPPVRGGSAVRSERRGRAGSVASGRQSAGELRKQTTAQAEKSGVDRERPAWKRRRTPAEAGQQCTYESVEISNSGSYPLFFM